MRDRHAPRIAANAPSGGARGADPTGRRRRRGGDQGEFTREELHSLVCGLFCEGKKVPEIQDAVKRALKIVISREEPYRIVAAAAKSGWLRFQPLSGRAVADQITRRFNWLGYVNVVHTTRADDVAQAAAERLLHLCTSMPRRDDNLHIGLAGGAAMFRVVSCFARLLAQRPQNLPRTLVFHSLVAGFDIDHPLTDPNVFLGMLEGDTAITVERKFVALHAPPLVKTGQLAELRQLAGIQEAYAGAKDLDIIVTSASLRADPHNLLAAYMSRCGESVERLKTTGWLGDILWRPIGPAGIIDDSHIGIRAMTLLELKDLPTFIGRSKHVVLVLGPCTHCGGTKAPMLKTVLTMSPHLVTDLIVDSRTARAGLGMLEA